MLPEQSFLQERDCVAQVFRNIQFCPDPFEHICTPAFFSNDFYAELKAQMPPISCYEAYRNGNGEAFGKFHFPLWVDGQNALSVLEPERRIFWERFVTLVLVSIFRNIIDKYSAFFCLRFDGKANVPLKFDVRLAIDITGSRGYVHTDNPDFVTKFIVYLPDDNSLGHCGTGLYEPEDSRYRDIGNGHKNPSRFKIVRQIPFHPNTMVSFF